jgi:dTMP kinase
MKNKDKIVSQLLVLCGLDGAGKSSQISELRNFIEKLGLGVICTREPGGTPASEQLRDMLKYGVDAGNYKDVFSEKSTLLGMFMSRYNLHEKRIKPAVDNGDIVISDRFAGSTYAYQVYNNPEFKDLFDMLLKMGEFTPQFTIFLDVSYEESCKRMGNRGEALDEIELRNKGEDKFNNLRQGYMEYLEKYQKNTHVIIDTTNLNEEQVLAAIIDKILIKC